MKVSLLLLLFSQTLKNIFILTFQQNSLTIRDITNTSFRHVAV